MTDHRISDDFKKLGDHLAGILKAAWDQPERKSVQSEIEKGLTELGAALNQAVQEFSASETGQKIKVEASQVHDRIESGELENSLREGLSSALQKINRELEVLTEKLQNRQG